MFASTSSLESPKPGIRQIQKINWPQEPEQRGEELAGIHLKGLLELPPRVLETAAVLGLALVAPQREEGARGLHDRL